MSLYDQDLLDIHFLELVKLDQKERVLYWFNNISPELTSLQGIHKLSIISLPTRICELRRKYSIESKRDKGFNKFGEKVNFVRYTFKGGY